MWMTVALVSFSACCLFTVTRSTDECTLGCGWQANCIKGICSCPEDYRKHERQCQNVNCTLNDCLECNSHDKCRRCINFIDEETRLCLEKCNGLARTQEEGEIQGSVCSAFTHRDDNIDIITGVVAGVSVGMLLCLIIALAFYFHLRRTRKKINFQQKKYKAEDMQFGKHKAVSLYDNKGFEIDTQIIRNSVIDKDVYMMELDRLRPHASTLLMLLNQIRQRLRAMDGSDARVPTYKGVIHQLCRVLVLLHKKEPSISIPSDALGLLEWAEQMLEDYRQELQDQSTSQGSFDGPTSRISYIDVPESQQQTLAHQYAVPHVNQGVDPSNINHSQQSSLSHQSDTGYYSSAPVPVEYHSNTLPYAQIRSSVSQSNTLKCTKKTNTHRAYNGSNVNNQHFYASDNSLGYIANGRYYDPTPRKEIYAPASSYSDRSNHLLSTFVADNNPRRNSFSSSNNSAADLDRETRDDVGSTENENDVLPFDPKDVTAPVEV